MDIDKKPISIVTRKSCASIILQCLSESGISDWENAFKRQIDTAKMLGQMPDDIKVIRETLKSFGFIMQSAQLEVVRVHTLLKKIQNLSNAVVFIQVVDHKHSGGNMIVLRMDDSGYKVLCPPRDRTDDILGFETIHVWIKWDDDIDRSPFPRRVPTQRNEGSSKKKTYEETDSFKPFQPNPCDNYIGDCVVRGIAGALDISWAEAVDLLASENETTLNAREVYPQTLLKNGFYHHKPMIRDGHRLKGKAFCAMLNKTFHNGERIFAHVGRSHVAAIVPTADNNTTRYKILDAWDSSDCTIGEYWTGLADNRIDNNAPVHQDAPAFCVGEKLQHRSFGTGIITDVIPGVLTVDFGTNGIRKLGESWVRCNCRYDTSN